MSTVVLLEPSRGISLGQEWKDSESCFETYSQLEINNIHASFCTS